MKDFETPLGTVQSETALITELEKNLPFDPFQDEIVHKTEHTIEFQLLFLKYCFKDGTPFKVIPVLCSSFHDVMSKGVAPMENPQFNAFITVLRDTLKASSYRTCFIASADLAHCGVRFGDTSPPSHDFLLNLEREDRALLGAVEKMDSEAFYLDIQRVKDRRNICGLPPIYTLLTLLDADQGSLLDYQQSVEPGGGSVVTYASMVFN